MAALVHDGVRGLFASFHPLVQWSDGELSIPGHRDQELRLDGRGLLLIPAYFCLGAPVTLVDPTLQPVLIYPAERHLGRLSEDHMPDGALAALLGATRAAMLFAIDINHASSTTELSRHLGISAASASEHATILRQAGMITSHRNRNRVLHQPTSLGRAILADTQRPEQR